MIATPKMRVAIMKRAGRFWLNAMAGKTSYLADMRR
jgi:hypothetical protein